MIHSILVAAVLAVVPVDITARERCDVIELNTHYDLQAKPIYTQYIFYDWCTKTHRHHVFAYKIHIPRGLVSTDYVNGDYVFTYHDYDTVRTIRAKSYRETITQQGVTEDPEFLERDYWPKECRRGFMTPVIVK